MKELYSGTRHVLTCLYDIQRVERHALEWQVKFLNLSSPFFRRLHWRLPEEIEENQEIGIRLRLRLDASLIQGQSAACTVCAWFFGDSEVISSGSLCRVD